MWGQSFGGPDRVVEPHQEIARVERRAGDVVVERVNQAEELVDRQIRVVLDGDSYTQIAEAWGEPGQDLASRGDLRCPGRIDAEPGMAVGDVDPRVRAA